MEDRGAGKMMKKKKNSLFSDLISGHTELSYLFLLMREAGSLSDGSENTRSL